MIEIQPGDFVVIRDTGEVGEVVEVSQNPTSYRVRARGTSSTYTPYDIMGLTPAQVLILNKSLSTVAQVIDAYYDPEIYDPIYDAEGVIQYSSSAAAVFRVLEFPRLIVELGSLSDRVAILQKELEEARAQR